MSENPAEIVTIYVQLADGSSGFLRGVKAEIVAPEEYLILPIGYDREGAEWEFPPGSVVRCKREIRSHQEILVARTLLRKIEFIYQADKRLNETKFFPYEEPVQNLDEIAEDCLRVTEIDYLGLYQIASYVRCNFRALDLSDEQVKALSLEVVRLVVAQGLLAGDYDYGGQLYFWKESTADEIVARIDKEWDPKKGDPSLPESICWFSTRHS
jgi:hypothetical protein